MYSQEVYFLLPGAASYHPEVLGVLCVFGAAKVSSGILSFQPIPVLSCLTWWNPYPTYHGALSSFNCVWGFPLKWGRSTIYWSWTCFPVDALWRAIFISVCHGNILWKKIKCLRISREILDKPTNWSWQIKITIKWNCTNKKKTNGSFLFTFFQRMKKYHFWEWEFEWLICCYIQLNQLKSENFLLLFRTFNILTLIYCERTCPDSLSSFLM